MRIGICSGYFNCLTDSHVDYLNGAKSLCDIIIVIVNNDEQVLRKGSCPFQNEKCRLKIIDNLRCVDQAILSIDKDGTIAETMKKIVGDYDFIYSVFSKMFGEKNDIEWTFFKGGDRNPDNNPLPSAEVEICKDFDIEIKYGIGGFEKVTSSSKLIDDATKWNNLKFIKRIRGLIDSGKIDAVNEVEFILEELKKESL